MVSTRGKGSLGIRVGCGGKRCPQCMYYKRMGHTQENCYSLHGFLEKTTNISKSRIVEPKFFDEK